MTVEQYPLAVTGFNSAIRKTLNNMMEAWKMIHLLLSSYILEKQIQWLCVKITLLLK